MIQSGFLSEEDRKALTALARDGSSPCRVSRRANALVLLDKGWSCQQVADALLLDDDPIRGWRKLFEQLAIEQTSGRQRINIHGAINLETGQTRMIEALTIDAASTIRLLQSIETLYPMLALIHVFLDNARYHHARLVQEWLALPGRRIKLHFIPTYCPHLNPIERLWGGDAQKRHAQQVLR